MNQEQKEKKLKEFLEWIKADSFEVFKDYLLRKKVAYEVDIAKMLRADGASLEKIRVARVLADNIDLVLTTHIDGIIKELKSPDQVDDTQIY